MRISQPPKIDGRRKTEFSSELYERARAWIPSWASGKDDGDFGSALIEIAARFNSEVVERLDLGGEKMRQGLFDWLGIRGKAARPARVPVVFRLADAARQPVLASAPVQLQIDVDGNPVIFETESDLSLLPGKLDILVAVDPANDAFYLPPPGLNDLTPIEQLPVQWQLKSFAAAGTDKLQLDPDAGLSIGTVIEAFGAQYQITKSENGIATIDPSLDTDLAEKTVFRKITAFTPFDGKTRDRQEHALYLGHEDLLNIQSAATIDIVGGSSLRTGITWQYWGKSKPTDEAGWHNLEIVDSERSDALVLAKPNGSIDPRTIGDIKSRWIRAYTKRVGLAEPLLLGDDIRIRINSGDDLSKCPKNSVTPIDAMAGNTPLVVDNVFFPLGREPRQFDAFYLGSQEAFSKAFAKVQVCFEMADPTFYALSALQSTISVKPIIAGVAKDRSLHLIEIDPNTGSLSKFGDREPLQPPNPGFAGKLQEEPPIGLDSPFPEALSMPGDQRGFRLPIWNETGSARPPGFSVAASSGNNIWVWSEVADPYQSGWTNFGGLPEAGDHPVTGLVYLGDAFPQIFALQNGKLYSRQWPNGTDWTPLATTVRLASIVPVLDTALATSLAEGMIGVSDDDILYSVNNTGQCTKLLSQSNKLPSPADIAVRPVAIRNSASELIVAFVKPSLDEICSFHQIHGEATIKFEDGARVLGLDVTSKAGELHFFASLSGDHGAYAASWVPQTSDNDPIRYVKTTITAATGTVGGGPMEVSGHLTAPGTQGDSFTAPFDPNKRIEGASAILPGVLIPTSVAPLAIKDVVMQLVAGIPEKRSITEVGTTKYNSVFYPIESSFPTNADGSLLAYKESAPLIGNVKAANQFEFQKGDFTVTKDSFVLISGAFYTVTALDKNLDPWVATVTPNILGSGQQNYSTPFSTDDANDKGKLTSYMKLDPPNNQWDAELLKTVDLDFPGCVPDRQAAMAFSLDVTGHASLVVLKENIKVLPAGIPTFAIETPLGAWRQNREDDSANPELSWEYWNGKGWGKLLTEDGTHNLKTSGVLRFTIPDDIAVSDWAGKTNFWIRARLIGGDYGREKITTISTPLANGSTSQTFVRSTEGIRAPSVLSLQVSYQIAGGGELPTYLLSQDSGSVVDQSQANLTPGAVVEAFVPISLMIDRMRRTSVSSSKDSGLNEPCDCPKDQTSAKEENELADTGDEKALYLGLAARVSDGPVNLLLLVDKESQHDALAPMKVEALTAGQFIPLVFDDKTRALGESGILSMSFAGEPALSELFGATRVWLRLSPKSTEAEWTPSLRGVYLNAVFADSAETLTRELVGSSDGSPALTVYLARPPVLLNTLELRIREPLGEEERNALTSRDITSVLTNVESLPGDWVRWSQVVDPADEGPADRVYALDEGTGQIRFGDGIHGKIPPIGRDCIVAFGYRRTEPGKVENETFPGNSVAPRTALNLVSPVESVEAVIAADQAAGGSPPESDERVLRFGAARLRHRERAVTAEDIEDIVLESSPGFAQAKIVIGSNGILLVVVMKGPDPTPNAAEIREIRRLLGDVSSVLMTSSHGLQIHGPKIHSLRVELELEIDRLEHAGSVSQSVKVRLAEFFDSTTGGIYQDGWKLGANPDEDDIGFVLNNSPYIKNIEAIKLLQVNGDGVVAWLKIGPTDIVKLDSDPVRITFKTMEVTV